MSTTSASLHINEILPNGDCGLMITFVESEDRLQWIHLLAENLLLAPLPKQLNVVPAMDSLVLFFAEPINAHLHWHQYIESRIAILEGHAAESTVHTIPVCYAEECAADLLLVCEQLGISQQQLIELHTEPLYQVAMLGFLPGFAYLQGNHENLGIARKATPAVSVAAGSVAIANGQTGIYSLNSPGGWYVIGCTPAPLINWQHEYPLVLRPLDRVQFETINISDFKGLQGYD